MYILTEEEAEVIAAVTFSDDLPYNDEDLKPFVNVQPKGTR
jgi:hypothetical protein